jgi:hypothetical protein
MYHEGKKNMGAYPVLVYALQASERIAAERGMEWKQVSQRFQ